MSQRHCPHCESLVSVSWSDFVISQDGGAEIFCLACRKLSFAPRTAAAFFGAVGILGAAIAVARLLSLSGGVTLLVILAASLADWAFDASVNGARSIPRKYKRFD